MFNNSYNFQARPMRQQQNMGFNPMQHQPMRTRQNMGFNPMIQPFPMPLQQTATGNQDSSFNPQNLINMILQLLQQLQGGGSQPFGGMQGGIGTMPQQPTTQPETGLIGLNPDGTRYTVTLPTTPTNPSTQEPPQPIPGYQYTYTGPTPIPVQYGNGITTLGRIETTGEVTRSDAQMREQFELFKNSDQYPAVETRDLVTTPWGYQGSSSALEAFYVNTWEKGPILIV